MLNEITNNIGNNNETLDIDKEYQYIDKGFIDTLKFTTGTGKQLTVANISVQDLTALVGNINDLTSKTIQVTELVFDEILGKLLFGDKVALSIENFTLKVGEDFTYLDIRSTSRPTWNSSQLAITSDISNPLKLIGVGKTEDRPTEDLQPGDYYLSTDEPPLTVYVYGTDNVWHQFVYETLDMYRSASEQDVIDAEIKQSITDNKKASDNKDIELQTQISNLETKETEDIENVNAELTVINEDINDIKAEQTTQNKNISDNATAITTKINDAPASNPKEQTLHYARNNKQWVPIDNMFDDKYVPIVSYETIHSSSLPAGTILQRNEVYVQDDPERTTLSGWWLRTTPLTSKYPQYASLITSAKYSTKEEYDYVMSHWDVLEADAQQTFKECIIDPYDAGYIIGNIPNVLNYDSQVPISGEGCSLQTDIALNVGTIENDDGAVNIISNKAVTVSTPGSDYPLEIMPDGGIPPSTWKAATNIGYLWSHLKVSTTKSENDRVLQVKTYNDGSDPLASAASAVPASSIANIYTNNLMANRFYVRTKDYVYYKVDNVSGQSASSFVFWFSIDKDGNVINMTDPASDNEQAVAAQTDFETWMTYHPSAWNGTNDNYAYFPRTGTLSSIEIYNNGKHIGHVTDGDGLYTPLYSVPVTEVNFRSVGGKSLRNPNTSRILMVNNSTSADNALLAGIIGVDKYGNEGLNKFKSFNIPTNIIYGPNGVAAGKNHWYAQEATSNTWMTIDKNGEIKSYVLKDPVTGLALGATIQNCMNNFIELENGDCMFFVLDVNANICYHIYCRDDFEEDEDPFVVYRSGVNYSLSSYPLCKFFPYIEFGDFIYFIPTTGSSIDGTALDTTTAAANTLLRSYSRFNKTTKTWVDMSTPWNVNNGQIVCVKTYDKEEDKDYMWMFQAQSETTSASPRQYICQVFSEDGQITQIDLKNSTRTPWYTDDTDAESSIVIPNTGESVSADIPWFDNSAVSNTTLLSTYAWPLNNSGTVGWSYRQTVRPTMPYVAVTRKGIGVIVSNAARDIMVFYGNCKFYRKSYPNVNSQGPFGTFTTQGAGNACYMLPGIDGVKLAVVFNNDLVTIPANNSAVAMIYIKIDENDPLKEPKYFWKPYPLGSIYKRYLDKIDSAGYYITDASEYKRANFQEITPLSNWSAGTMRGMTTYEIEAPVVSKTLYLKDNERVISSTNI